MLTQARKRGWYKGVQYRPGMMFILDDEEHYDDSWMQEPIPSMAKAVNSPGWITDQKTGRRVLAERQPPPDNRKKKQEAKPAKAQAEKPVSG